MKSCLSGLGRPKSFAIGRRRRLVVSALSVLLLPWAEAQNFERGEELFEDHCQACHDDMHRPESRHAPSLAELRKRIEAWALHTDARWQQDEVNDVLFYLNRSFYKFPEKPL
jgi:mono/diheme cytochrome c family protein